MAEPRRIEWRRGVPRRALGNLCWYLVLVALLLAGVWLLFGDEPTVHDDGARNPLTLVPETATVLAAVGATVLLLPVLRRPLVAADHTAVYLRGGVGPCRRLPWVTVAQVAVASCGDEQYLVVQLCRDGDRVVRQLTALDRLSLRQIQRCDPFGAWGTYDVAVPMREFVGGGEARMTALVAFAPDTVMFRT